MRCPFLQSAVGRLSGGGDHSKLSSSKALFRTRKSTASEPRGNTSDPSEILLTDGEQQTPLLLWTIPPLQRLLRMASPSLSDPPNVIKPYDPAERWKSA